MKIRDPRFGLKESEIVSGRTDARTDPPGHGSQSAEPLHADPPEAPFRLTIENFLTDKNQDFHESEFWTDGPAGREII